MKIKLMSNSASERLLWQHRILSCQPPEPIEWVVEACDILDKWVWIISDLATLNTYKSTHQSVVKDAFSLVILTDAFRLENGTEAFQEALGTLEGLVDELLNEANYEANVLRQCLFKPRVKRRPEQPGVASGFIKKWSQAARQKDSAFKPLRIKLCISGQGALAYELGAMLSLKSNCRVLILDLDRLQPTADLYTGVKPILEGRYDFFSKASATGINVLLDCAKKGTLHREVFTKCTQVVKGYEHLEVLTGIYQLNDYEYYRAEDLKPIIEQAAGYYDVIIMKTNDFLYDGFTLMAMKLADYIITALAPDIAALRAYRQKTSLLQEKQGILLENQCWVMFETKKTKGLEMAFYENLAGSGCLGQVPPLELRQTCTTTGAAYLKTAKKQLEIDYQPLLQSISRREADR